jgi:DUF1365 family protein
MQVQSAIYAGHVVHKRLRPKVHELRYRVFALLLDLDRIDETARGLRLFSHNRFNLVSFYDSDHADRSGRPAGEQVRALLAGSGIAGENLRILALCYPRILGYVFNPLTTYFCVDAAGRLQAVVYEVSNTFGERRSYVLPVGGQSADGAVHQTCAKQLYVSPFNTDTGRYTFHLHLPEEEVTVGVNLRDESGPLLKAHFHGTRQRLDDRSLARHLVRFPLLTLKVIVAIHYEALRLWLKGLKLTTRTPAAPFAVSHMGGRHHE